MTTRRTLSRTITAEGIALHAGGKIRMILAPAPSGAGIVFRRSDLGGKQIPALYDKVSETRLGTVIADSGVSVGVIEHLMSAAAGARVDDMIVTLDGPEPPILDGDALSYLTLLEQAGFCEQAGARQAIEILKRVEVKSGEASAALVPAKAYAFDFEIVFASPAIGTQRMDWSFSSAAFRRDIAPARTFGFVHELEGLKKMGLGNGASLDNTLAIEGDAILNAKLMRFPDEFVRHKILDAIGDMALAGAPILGRFEGRRSGHALNNALLRALFADPANWRMVEPGQSQP
jgi:UDP-3-O-[3-hydroxymyristoyl] N-acetylglucosamine deacetylase